jgi:hypothetical protein
MRRGAGAAEDGPGVAVPVLMGWPGEEPPVDMRCRVEGDSSSWK